MAGSVVFVWEVQSICRSQTWNPNVTETHYTEQQKRSCFVNIINLISLKVMELKWWKWHLD